MPLAVEVEMHIAFGWKMVDKADLLDSLDLGLDTAHIVFYSLHLCQYEAEALKKKNSKENSSTIPVFNIPVVSNSLNQACFQCFKQ